MNFICANCKHYRREYYRDEQNLMRRYSLGFCKRIRARRLPEKTCARFELREIESEPEEELIIRRQELLAEIEDLTKFLEKIKGLANIVIQIQELLLQKE